MIILTAALADKVRGRSPSVSRSALWPIPLKDGTYFLPEEVLNDPAHADVTALLKAAPTATTGQVAANSYAATGPSPTLAQDYPAAEVAKSPTGAVRVAAAKV